MHFYICLTHPRRDVDNVGELGDEVLQVGDLLLEVAPRRQRLFARVQVGGGGRRGLGLGVLRRPKGTVGEHGRRRGQQDDPRRRPREERGRVLLRVLVNDLERRAAVRLGRRRGRRGGSRR